jgi:hypothetical protein
VRFPSFIYFVSSQISHKKHALELIILSNSRRAAGQPAPISNGPVRGRHPDQFGGHQPAAAPDAGAVSAGGDFAAGATPAVEAAAQLPAAGVGARLARLAAAARLVVGLAAALGAGGRRRHGHRLDVSGGAARIGGALVPAPLRAVLVGDGARDGAVALHGPIFARSGRSYPPK